MKILLADDHQLVRDGLKPILARLAPDTEITEAESFHGAMDMAGRCGELGLAILDLKMPGMNGFAGISSFIARFPGIPVVILSGLAGRGEVLAAMNAGAAAFIPKTTGGPAILAALRLVLCGERYFPPDIISPATPSRPADAPPGGFTEKERETLRLVVGGVSNKEIARMLGVEEITVKKRLSGLYKKLGVRNRLQLMALARGIDDFR